MKRVRFQLIMKFFIFALLFIGLAGLVVMSLWNALLPDILGLKTINFWQALGLLVLSRILFGGPGWRGGRMGGGPRGAGWKQHMAEHWQSLTPEQRARMKNNWCRPPFGRRDWNRSAPEAPIEPETTE